MLVAAFTWGDLWRLALAVFLLAVGLSAAFLLVRLGGTAECGGRRASGGRQDAARRVSARAVTGRGRGPARRAGGGLPRRDPPLAHLAPPAPTPPRPGGTCRRRVRVWF